MLIFIVPLFCFVIALSSFRYGKLKSKWWRPGVALLFMASILFTLGVFEALTQPGCEPIGELQCSLGEMYGYASNYIYAMILLFFAILSTALAFIGSKFRNH